MNWTKDDRNDSRLALIVLLNCSFHFFAITILRSHETWTHKQKYKLCCIEVLVDLLFPVRAWADIRVIPDGNEAFSLQWYQVRLQFIQKHFVFAGITAEDF